MSEPCQPQRYAQSAPPDDACTKAWNEIMQIARVHALIVNAYGGVATLAVPEEQRKHEGLRQRVLDAHMMNEAAGRDQR